LDFFGGHGDGFDLVFGGRGGNLDLVADFSVDLYGELKLVAFEGFSPFIFEKITLSAEEPPNDEIIGLTLVFVFTVRYPRVIKGTSN